MKENIQPDLIARKVIKKLNKKHFKNQSKSEQLMSTSKLFLINNWYILLILSFICFLLYLKYDENKKKKEGLSNTNIKKTESIKSLNDFQQIQRVAPDVNNLIPKYLY